MSVTFSSNAPFSTSSKQDACLCAQFATTWSAFRRGERAPEVLAELAKEADSNCYFCKGTGVETVEETDAPEINLSNGNARLLIEALGLKFDYCGEISIPEARRAVMRARSRSSLAPFTRAPERIHGAPRVNDDGTIELAPIRMMSGGLDEDGIRSRIERFASLVEECAARGASVITWG